MHGGATPSGPASPHWKHGRKSKHRWYGSLPKTSLGTRFDQALADPELANLRAAMALNDAMLTSYMASLRDSGRPLNTTQQDRVHKLIDMQGRLAEKEARRLRDLGAMVTQVQFQIVMNTVAQLINEYVSDLVAKREIHRRLMQTLLGIGQPGTGERGDDGDVSS